VVQVAQVTQPANWIIEYYTDASGASPVLEYIESLSDSEQVKVAYAILLLREFGTLLRMPHARPIEKGLWELRADVERIFYFAHTGRRFILLHAYRKKSQKTPDREIDTAQRRRADFVERGQ
jgi:phage-related protein